MQDACAYSLEILILFFKVELSSKVGTWYKLAYTSLLNKNDKNISLKFTRSTLMGLISQMGQSWQDFHVLLKDEPKG